MRVRPSVFAGSLSVLSTAPALALVLAAAPARAAEVDDAPPPTAALAPRRVDVKASFRTSPIVQYGGIGASADVGVTRIGPGTLAAGGSLAYEACGSTCWAAPLDFNQHQTWIEGRASYHLAAAKIGYLDFYPLVTLGFVVAASSIHVGGAGGGPSGTSEYRGSSVGPTVGFGAGASYFFADRFFVSAEATLRYAGSSYTYELASGPPRAYSSGGVDGWSSNTIALALGAGARF